MRYTLGLLCFVFSCLSLATPLSLKNDAPHRYVVKKGDTLWSIANRYLDKPWEWKTLWHANPKIKNPNRLYAGAVLELERNDPHPYLKVLSNGVVKWSPHIRATEPESPVPPIPLNDILPFLNGSIVFDNEDLLHAPYVVAFTDEHMLGGQGDQVYVARLRKTPVPDGTTLSYNIFRPEKVYYAPVSHEVLGYEATLVGECDLVDAGEPATVMITNVVEGVKIKDRVIPNDQPDFNFFFEPQAPIFPVLGTIIDLPGKYTQAAAGFIAVIDRGEDAGLRPGDVLGIYAKSRQIPDPMHPSVHYPDFLTTRYPSLFPPQKTITLPPKRLGELMVFRVFTQTSFALIVRSIRAIKKLDVVTPP